MLCLANYSHLGVNLPFPRISDHFPFSGIALPLAVRAFVVVTLPHVFPCDEPFETLGKKRPRKKWRKEPHSLSHSPQLKYHPSKSEARFWNQSGLRLGLGFHRRLWLRRSCTATPSPATAHATHEAARWWRQHRPFFQQRRKLTNTLGAQSRRHLVWKHNKNAVTKWVKQVTDFSAYGTNFTDWNKNLYP